MWQSEELKQYHYAVVGGAGIGKTHLIKMLLDSLSIKGHNTLILNHVGEYPEANEILWNEIRNIKGTGHMYAIQGVVNASLLGKLIFALEVTRNVNIHTIVLENIGGLFYEISEPLLRFLQVCDRRGISVWFIGQDAIEMKLFIDLPAARIIAVAPVKKNFRHIKLGILGNGAEYKSMKLWAEEFGIVGNENLQKYHHLYTHDQAVEIMKNQGHLQYF